MKWLLGTCTSRFNRRYKLFGHLFCVRYKSLIVDGSGSGYLKSVGDYVHLNLARAKLVVADAPLESFAWSSWPVNLLAHSKRPAWLRVVFNDNYSSPPPVTKIVRPCPGKNNRRRTGRSVAGRVGHPQGQSGGTAMA
jgi:hypothetical protein